MFLNCSSVLLRSTVTFPPLTPETTTWYSFPILCAPSASAADANKVLLGLTSQGWVYFHFHLNDCFYHSCLFFFFFSFTQLYKNGFDVLDFLYKIQIQVFFCKNKTMKNKYMLTIFKRCLWEAVCHCLHYSACAVHHSPITHSIVQCVNASPYWTLNHSWKSPDIPVHDEWACLFTSCSLLLRILLKVSAAKNSL